MANKKALGTLTPISTAKAKKPSNPVEAEVPLRGSVQTVRMDRGTLKALKGEAFERGISQNDLMLGAIRRELGLE